MNLIYVAYGGAFLYSVALVLYNAWLVVRRKEGARNRMFSDLDILIFAAVLFASVWLTAEGLREDIPDGTYVAAVGVQYPNGESPVYTLAEISTSNEVEYEDRDSFSGGWEHTVTERYQYRRFEITGLYAKGPDRKPVNMCAEISPNSAETIEINGEMAVAFIGDLSADSFGITMRDNWNARDTLWKLRVGLAPTCCVVGLAQIFLLDEERKKEIEEWYKVSKS